MSRLDKLSMEELLARQNALVSDPKNKQPPGSFYIYDKKTQDKLSKIAWAITTKLREKKATMGNDEDDFEEPDEPEEPDEGDWTTEDHRRFYSDRELVLDLPADTGECEMWAAIETRMKEDGFWPNVWWISDHGNAHLMVNPGNKVCRPPRKKKKGKKKRGAKLGGLSRDFTRDCGPSGCEIKRR